MTQRKLTEMDRDLGRVLFTGLTDKRGKVWQYAYDGNGDRLTRPVNRVTECCGYDDGDHKADVGFGGSQGLGMTGGAALTLSSGVAALPRATPFAAEAGGLGELTGSGAVIGNNTARVTVASDVFESKAFSYGNAGKVGGWFKNLGWMLKQLFTKDFILDAGPVPRQTPYGPWYSMERFVTRLLCN